MKKRPGFDGLKREFRGVWRYLKESRRYIYAVMIIFILGGISGFFFYSQFGFLDAILKQLARKTENLGLWQMIWFILSNNVQSAFSSVALGVILGVVPALSSLVNGVTLGYVLHKVWQINGITQFWRILPHGIFELPAIFISMGLGLRMGFFVFSKNRWMELKYRAYNSIMTFFFVILPLLIIAAIIEGLLVILSK